MVFFNKKEDLLLASCSGLCSTTFSSCHQAGHQFHLKDSCRCDDTSHNNTGKSFVLWHFPVTWNVAISKHLIISFLAVCVIFTNISQQMWPEERTMWDQSHKATSLKNPFMKYLNNSFIMGRGFTLPLGILNTIVCWMDFCFRPQAKWWIVLQ